MTGVGRRVAGDGLNADFLAMFGRRQERSREMCKMEHLVSNLSIKSELRRHKEHRVFKRRGEMKIRTSKTPEPVYYHPLCSCPPSASSRKIKLEELVVRRLSDSNEQLLWREFGV